MGRYYSGDINGKFGFGTQSSDAADRFGCIGQQPNYLEYYFDKDNFDVEELKGLVGKLNKGLQFIAQFVKDETFVILDHNTKTTKEKALLENGLVLNQDDTNLFGKYFENNELENNLYETFSVIYCFVENDKREYQNSEYGMKLEGVSNEDTDKILVYVKDNNLVSDFEDLVLGAQIYNHLQKEDECYFTAEL